MWAHRLIVVFIACLCITFFDEEFLACAVDVTHYESRSGHIDDRRRDPLLTNLFTVRIVKRATCMLLDCHWLTALAAVQPAAGSYRCGEPVFVGHVVEARGRTKGKRRSFAMQFLHAVVTTKVGLNYRTRNTREETLWCVRK